MRRKPRGSRPPAAVLPESVDLVAVLEEAGALSRDDLDRARTVAEERGIRLADAVVALGLMSEEQLRLLAADRLGVEYVFPSAECVDGELVRRFPVDALRRLGALPMAREAGGAVVAFADLPDPAALDELARVAGGPIRPVLASRRRLETVLERVCGSGRLDPAQAAALDASGMTAFYRHLTAALAEGARELRFEPSAAGVRVRYRRDGALLDRGMEPASLAVGIASRARALARLPAPDAPALQTAEVEATVAGRTLRLEAAIVPTAEGEAVVLRMEGPRPRPRRLEEFGGDPAAFASLREFAKGEGGSEPGGLVLLASPDRPLRRALGYAVLEEADAEARAVATVEDEPLARRERFLQLAAGDGGFARALEAALAASPDLLLVDGAEDASALRAAVRGALLGARVLLGLDDAEAEDAAATLAARIGSPARAARALRFAVAVAADGALALFPGRKP